MKRPLQILFKALALAVIGYVAICALLVTLRAASLVLAGADGQTIDTAQKMRESIVGCLITFALYWLFTVVLRMQYRPLFSTDQDELGKLCLSMFPDYFSYC